MQNTEKAFIQVYTCLVLVLFAWNSINTIQFPYGVDYGEAPLMDQVRRIEARQILYKSDINDPPYTIANYPPLYPYWVAATNLLTKIPLFQAGRVTSVVFSIVSGWIIALFASRLTDNKWFGVFSAALFLGHPYVMIWSSLARVDLMALAFSLVGLWIIYRYSNSTVGLILAGFCILASAFTRQSYILSAPLAGFVWLWSNNHKRALIFFSLVGVIGFFIFGIINAMTHGGFFTNIVTANINYYDISHAISLTKQLVMIWPFILITCVIMVMLTIYKTFRPPSNNQVSTLKQPFIFNGLAFYTLGAVISAITIGKIGSNVNYFLELIVAGAIWCALALKVIIEQKKVIKLIFLGVLFIQSVWALGYSYQLSRITSADLWGRLDVYDSLNELVQSAVRKGIVLSDDFMDMIVLSGQPIYYQPFEYGELYYGQIWDPTKLVDQINQREFPLIIIGGTSLNKGCCWVPSVVEALQMNYEIETLADKLILTPKQ